MAAHQGKANDGIEERETFLQHAPEDKGGFRTFLYDKNRGTCLGRTARSWVEITIFYIIFYICLAGFWAACLAVFVKTLDDKVPRYYGKGTIIGANPGMGYQPWLKTDGDSTLIMFTEGDINNNTFEKYTTVLDEFLKKYTNTEHTRKCTGTDSNKETNNEDACVMDLAVFEKLGCSNSTSYGFANGTPCIIVTLNRLIGWEPVKYPDESAPEAVKKYYKDGVAISCEGEYEPDSEVLGEVTYIPAEGLPSKYFPYRIMKNYHQPFAMVKFLNLPRNRLVQVECKAYAYNILHDSTDRLGVVHFELLVEKNSKTWKDTLEDGDGDR